ncbi:MAG TPA: hypothetical protein VGR43_01100, partial [Dehalococcoidia bacterium]|nr:hypothetical protein [Dehalococcoidia bacterium]
MDRSGNSRSPNHRRRLLAAAAGRPVSSLSIALLVASALLAVIALASLMFGWALTASAVQRHASLEPNAGSTLIGQSPDECPDGFVVDFVGLAAGIILGEQYASLGLHISAVANGGDQFPDNAIVFDSNSTDPDLDSDLRVGIGNIAILANNLDDVDGDGLVDRPDENNFGGKQIYAFDQPVFIGSFLFID